MSLYDHSEAFNMNMSQPVPLVPLISVHGWKGRLTAVYAHKERRHFLYKWFQSGKVCLRNQTPEVANICSEFNLKNVISLFALFLSFDASDSRWMMRCKLMKVGISSLLFMRPTTPFCLTRWGHHQYTHLQIWTSWGFFPQWRQHFLSKRILLWKLCPNMRPSNIGVICAFVHCDAETWHHVQIPRQLVMYVLSDVVIILFV